MVGNTKQYEPYEEWCEATVGFMAHGPSTRLDPFFFLFLCLSKVSNYGNFISAWSFYERPFIFINCQGVNWCWKNPIFHKGFISTVLCKAFVTQHIYIDAYEKQILNFIDAKAIAHSVEFPVLYIKMKIFFNRNIN